MAAFHRFINRTTSAFLLTLFVTGISLFCWPQVAVWWKGVSVESAGEQAETQLVSARVDVGRIPSKQAPAAMTRAIETLQVGDRVLAHNPEVPQAERDEFVEPQWNEWLQLSLAMPKADGSLLKIELLRPEAWVREQLGLVVEPAAIAAPPVTAESLSSAAAVYVDSVPYSPLLPILREVAATGAELQLSGEELRAIFVEMDLPELAITGPAIVEAIRGPPLIRAGAGRVVTATFHHSSGDVIDLVVGGDSNSTESIGTTSKHPFWSVDRQEYVQAGQLAIGERLQTYSGDTKRVLSKLARPGPQAVYNLEVFAEHVYYVGKEGVLVHNNQSYSAPNSETLSRGAYLRQKYAHLSPDQRAARIAELSEANYGRRIADLESTYGAPGVHSFEKHGAQTGIMSQFRRVQQADFPNPTTGAAGNQTKNASMFLSNRDHYETLAYAIRQKAAGAAGNIPVAFDRTIGVSVTNLGSYANRGPFQIRLTNKASVRFDQLGRFYTAFPEP